MINTLRREPAFPIGTFQSEAIARGQAERAVLGGRPLLRCGERVGLHAKVSFPDYVGEVLEDSRHL